MRVVKNDTVIVIAGDDRGKTGRVLKVFPSEQRVLVESINFVKRHTKRTQKIPKGGILEKEAPIHISNVMVFCRKCEVGTKVKMKKLEDGSRVRVCKHCGEMIGVST